MVGQRAVVAFLLMLLLAGCSGKAPASDDQGATAQDAPGASSTPMDDPGAAPTWVVGQSWTHDWAIGSNTQFTLKSIVVDANNGYRLATDAQDNAIAHAVFFFHDLGQMDKAWSVHSGDLVYPWYSFPLTDGKTWSAHEENLDFNLQPVSRELTMTARLVNASGAIPAHYAIEQRTADGGLRATYDYRRDIGWFGDLALYDPGAPDSAPQLTLHTSSWGKGWTGTYYEASADFLLNYFTLSAPAAGQVSTNPQGAFTITAQHTHVMALSFAFAAGGAAHTELAAPDGQHWESNQVADQNGATLYGNGGLQVLVPAVPGDWHVAFVGASPFVAGGGCLAWGVTVTSATL